MSKWRLEQEITRRLSSDRRHCRVWGGGRQAGSTLKLLTVLGVAEMS